MEPHVKHVLKLWKSSFAETPSEATPYKLTQQLQNFASLFSPGLFYYYILDFQHLKMEYVHHTTKDVLGIEAETVTIENLLELLTPEERETMAKKEAVVVDFFFRFLNPKDRLSYKGVYFFNMVDSEGKSHKMLHQVCILTLDENDMAQHVMVVHTDVSHLSFIDKDKISFINISGGKSYLEVDVENSVFDPETADETETQLHDVLSFREKEIVRLIAQGCSVEEIAEELNISTHTVRTHRKNSLKKTCCKNTAELVSKCLLEGAFKI